MNEQENTRILQEGYRLFATGDIPNLLDTYSDDIVLIVPGLPGANPIAGRYVGKEQVKQFFFKVSETFEFSMFEPLETIAQHDKVVALGHYQGSTKATGQPIVMEFAHVFQFQDGRVKRFQVYEDTALIMAALSKANVGVG